MGWGFRGGVSQWACRGVKVRGSCAKKKKKRSPCARAITLGLVCSNVSEAPQKHKLIDGFAPNSNNAPAAPAPARPISETATATLQLRPQPVQSQESLAAPAARAHGKAAVPLRAQVQTPPAHQVDQTAMAEVDQDCAVEHDKLRARLRRLLARLRKGSDESEARGAAIQGVEGVDEGAIWRGLDTYHF